MKYARPKPHKWWNRGEKPVIVKPYTPEDRAIFQGYILDVRKENQELRKQIGELQDALLATKQTITDLKRLPDLLNIARRFQRPLNLSKRSLRNLFKVIPVAHSQTPDEYDASQGERAERTRATDKT